MMFIALLLTILMSKYGLCWVDYKFNFLTAKLDSNDPEFITIHNLEVKKFNRTSAYLHVNGTILKRVNNLTFGAQFYKYVSNRYKESFPKFTSDFCSFLSGAKQANQDDFSGKFLTKLRVPFREIFYRRDQNFPKVCPVIPGNYYVKMNIDENKFPAFLLPQGKWKLQVGIDAEGKNALLFSTTFEIINYVSEKQKHRT